MQVIHRNSVGKTIDDMAVFFLETEPQHTGGKFPYHYVIDGQGTVFQCVPEQWVAPGAVAFNEAGVQVALFGDFRKRPPTVKQGLALVRLCQDLYKQGATDIIGHTEREGGTADPDKVCPGPRLNLDGLRSQVKGAN